MSSTRFWSTFPETSEFIPVGMMAVVAAEALLVTKVSPRALDHIYNERYL